MEQTLIDLLDEFLGGRHLPDHLKKYLKSLEKPLNQTLYRGMNYPIHLIEVGKVVEEWHGSTHWSKDFQIAHNFAYDGYINDDYCEELNEQKELLAENNVKDAEELFVQVIFRLRENTKAIDIHSLIKDVPELSVWTKEQEVTFIDYDFVIEHIEYVNGEEPYYLIDVRENIQEEVQQVAV